MSAPYCSCLLLSCFSMRLAELRICTTNTGKSKDSTASTTIKMTTMKTSKKLSIPNIVLSSRLVEKEYIEIL